MDVLFFLRDRLTFIRNFYSDSTASFIETKRKIEANEEPYIYEFDPEFDPGEPPFLTEWQHADDCIISLGRWSVMLLSSALKGYLQEFSRDMSSFYGHRFPEFVNHKETLAMHQKKKGWLRGNKIFFAAVYKIDWDEGPKLIDSLEHLVLTRNDLEHNTDLVSHYISQTAAHKNKQANGIFTDRETYFWQEDEAQLTVDKDRLNLAIQSVEQFCAWLDSIREDYPRFRTAGSYDLFRSKSASEPSRC